MKNKKINLVSIIDDDDVNVFIIKKMIQKSEFAEESFFFQNGQAALDYMIQNQTNPERIPDMVFLDINMPVLDGWQFMEEFQKILPNIKKKISIYIVSSSVDEYDVKRAANTKEITDFILKPLTMQKLSEILYEFNVCG